MAHGYDCKVCLWLVGGECGFQSKGVAVASPYWLWRRGCGLNLLLRFTLSLIAMRVFNSSYDRRM